VEKEHAGIYVAAWFFTAYSVARREKKVASSLDPTMIHIIKSCCEFGH
jgi:hypothetical protein